LSDILFLKNPQTKLANNTHKKPFTKNHKTLNMGNSRSKYKTKTPPQQTNTTKISCGVAVVGCADKKKFITFDLK
jgi:hypothetical protein